MTLPQALPLATKLLLTLLSSFDFTLFPAIHPIFKVSFILWRTTTRTHQTSSFLPKGLSQSLLRYHYWYNLWCLFSRIHRRNIHHIHPESPQFFSGVLTIKLFISIFWSLWFRSSLVCGDKVTTCPFRSSSAYIFIYLPLNRSHPLSADLFHSVTLFGRAELSWRDSILSPSDDASKEAGERFTLYALRYSEAFKPSELPRY